MRIIVLCSIFILAIAGNSFLATTANADDEGGDCGQYRYFNESMGKCVDARFFPPDLSESEDDDDD